MKTVVFHRLYLGLFEPKLSHLHFQTLSQLDGLTGICKSSAFHPPKVRAGPLEADAGRRYGQAPVACILSTSTTSNRSRPRTFCPLELRAKPHGWSRVMCCLDKKRGSRGRFVGEEFVLPCPAVRAGRGRAPIPKACEQLRRTTRITA